MFIEDIITLRVLYHRRVITEKHNKLNIIKEKVESLFDTFEVLKISPTWIFYMNNDKCIFKYNSLTQMMYMRYDCWGDVYTNFMLTYQEIDSIAIPTLEKMFKLEIDDLLSVNMSSFWSNAEKFFLARKEFILSGGDDTIYID